MSNTFKGRITITNDLTNQEDKMPLRLQRLSSALWRDQHDTTKRKKAPPSH